MEQGAPAIFRGFDPDRVHSDWALNVRNRTQLLAALSTYRDSDDSGMIPMEGGSICVGIGIKHDAGTETSKNRCHTP